MRRVPLRLFPLVWATKCTVVSSLRNGSGLVSSRQDPPLHLLLLLLCLFRALRDRVPLSRWSCSSPAMLRELWALVAHACRQRATPDISLCTDVCTTHPLVSSFPCLLPEGGWTQVVEEVTPYPYIHEGRSVALCAPW